MAEQKDCKGCYYEYSTDIKVCLGICTYCERAYTMERDREIHEDLYVKSEAKE
jgi:hypothetical protein